MKFEYETRTETPRHEVFNWFERKGSFIRLMPPWEVADLVSSDDSLEDGAKRIFRFPMGPIKMTWVAEHTGYNPPEKFEDVMKKGPFSSWHHVHRFVDTGGSTIVQENIDYKLPLGVLGRVFGSRMVRKRLDRMFKAREVRLIRDLERHSDFSHISRKKILIAGSSGLIGTQLVAFLDTGGHDVWRLVRRRIKDGEKEIFWNPDTGEIDPADIEGFDIVIHLGGAGIGDKRWSKKRKELIVSSRKNSTTLLSDTLSSLEKKPEVFLIASAIGYYGDRGDEILTEKSPHGEGFLTETVLAWEDYSQSARKSGIRVIKIRNGIVLSAIGGALGRMLLPWKMGGGGRIGNGKQWMSWISMDDEIYAIHHLIMSKETEGAYNLTAPNPARQKVFAKVLGKVLRRPAFAPIPKISMRILFGELAGPLLFEGQHVLPSRLQQSGYQFVHEKLEQALRDTLGVWR
ncbi:MAG: TIGR01777 family oxidoreductase [Candidatus Thermoplasmatota archaeon]|nr:TIGR01777 family oxidoreductase [Candidatus Thermoplasmatota archaeon]